MCIRDSPQDMQYLISELHSNGLPQPGQYLKIACFELDESFIGGYPCNWDIEAILLDKVDYVVLSEKIMGISLT